MFKFEEGEKNIRIVRKHYLVMLPDVLGCGLMAFAPLLFYWILMSDILPFNQSIQTFVANFAFNFGSFGYAIWLLVLWVMFFIEWTDYYLDMIVITDKRIIDVEQKGFFHREVTSFLYDQIQDITVETRGVVRTFFKFGDLHIQTAGHNHEIIIKDAANPEDARILILQLERQALAKRSL